MEKTYLMRNKLLFTFSIMILYILLRRIPLNYIDFSSYTDTPVSVSSILMMAVNGSHYNFFVMSVGITPYISASIIIQIITAFRSEKAKARISLRKMNIIITVLSFIISLFIAFLYTNQFNYIDNFLLSRFVVFVELLTGTLFVQWLMLKNRESGIGGPSAIILVNIFDSLVTIISGNSLSTLMVPIILSIIVGVIMIYMEFKEKRIPLQRVSIHNSLADKNYLPIKLNPMGVMPVMFASALFSLLQMIFVGLDLLFPYNIYAIFKEQFNMTIPSGVIIYLLILFSLSVFFSIVFINPHLLSDQLLKNGDSIVNIPAGKETKRYLYKQVIKYSVISGLVLCVSLGVSLCLQFVSGINQNLATLPTTIMILVGILSNIYQECHALRSFDAYKRFL